MNIVIYRTGSQETFKPTILSFADGILLENDRLTYCDADKEGIRYMRAVFDTDPDTNSAYQLKEDMLILAPKDLEDVQLVTVDGKTLLIRNKQTGVLDCAMDLALENMLEEYLLSLSLEDSDASGAEESDKKIEFDPVEEEIDPLLDLLQNQGAGSNANF